MLDNEAGTLGPLRQGARVAVVGGGPAGSSSAIALRRHAAELGREVSVVLYEPRDFERDGNVCAGVLSPPFGRLLADLGLTLPASMVQRTIGKYTLHSNGERLELPNPPGAKEPTSSIRRLDLDRYLLAEAVEAGVTIRREIVSAFRFDADAANLKAGNADWESYDAVVCAFGLEGQVLKALESATDYKRPPVMRALLAAIPLGSATVERYVGDTVHALLPSNEPQIEFAALTPKREYVTVNAAGPKINEKDLDVVIGQFRSHGLLPEALPPAPRLHNMFPSGPAKHYYADRMVVVGNASGLMRPLKGKGLSAALSTGTRAARVMLEVGISRAAFAQLEKINEDITTDYSYGIFVRRLYRIARFLGYLEPVMRLATTEPALYRLFHTIVSGEGSYKQAVLSLLRPTLWPRLAGTIVAHEARRRFGSGPETAVGSG